MVLKDTEQKYQWSIADSGIIRKNLARRVRLYERRYEMPSDRMAVMLKLSCVRETAEVLKWMQSYHALRLLKSKTPMTGTHTTTTVSSTKSD